MEALVGSALWSAPGVGAIGTQGLFGAAGSFGAGGLITGAVSSIGGSTLLSGLLTGASAFGQVQAGNMNANILNLQARQSELNARMETIKGRQQALSIRQQLDRDLASQNATFAARGILDGEGTAAAAAAASRKNAAEDINIAQFGAAMGTESDRLQSAQYKAEAGSAKSAGYTSAVSTIAGSRSVTNITQSLLEGL